MFRKILFCFILMISPAWAELTVSFNPEEVHLGESTELSIDSPQAFQDKPDLSALTGVFAVGGQKEETVLNRVNGRKIRSYRLVYNLFPRQVGRLSSEGITIRNKLLPVAELNVLEPLNKAQLPIQIQASVAQDKFFPNETFFYTLKLTDGAGLMSGQMTQPTAENATIQLLEGMDRVYPDFLEDKPVQITERTYAITPLSEGPLTIQPVEIYGKILTKRQTTADLFDQGVLFDGTNRDWQEIRLETNPVHLTILPKPTDWKGWWLPATQVSLEAEDTFPDLIQVGDSLNRKIVLKAVGMMGEYLPKISQPQGDNIRVYPSPEERTTIQTPVGDVQGIEIMSLVLVPGQGGTIKIPAVQVAWFNTNTLKREVATIPEKVIEVQGSSQPIEEELEQSSPKPVPKKALPKPQKPQVEPKLPKETQQSAKKIDYTYLLIGGMALFLSLFILIYAVKHKKHKSYLLPPKKEKIQKKGKKPLDDLYPF